MIQVLHDFILETLTEKVPGIRSADYYCTEKGEIATPSLYLELTEVQSTVRSDNTLACTGHFQLDCIVANKTNTAHIEAQKLALDSAHQLILADFFSVNASLPKIKGIRCNDFSPDYEGAKAWCVEFSTDFTWGESIFHYIKPSKGFVGIDPKTGKKYKDDYREFNLEKPTKIGSISA